MLFHIEIPVCPLLPNSLSLSFPSISLPSLSSSPFPLSSSPFPLPFSLFPHPFLFSCISPFLLPFFPFSFLLLTFKVIISNTTIWALREKKTFLKHCRSVTYPELNWYCCVTIQVVAHEISHSWTGNLITNRNWEHFWYNIFNNLYLLSCSYIVVIFLNILRNWHSFSNQSLEYNTSMVSFQLAN